MVQQVQKKSVRFDLIGNGVENPIKQGVNDKVKGAAGALQAQDRKLNTVERSFQKLTGHLDREAPMEYLAYSLLKEVREFKGNDFSGLHFLIEEFREQAPENLYALLKQAGQIATVKKKTELTGYLAQQRKGLARTPFESSEKLGLPLADEVVEEGNINWGRLAMISGAFLATSLVLSALFGGTPPPKQEEQSSRIFRQPLRCRWSPPGEKAKLKEVFGKPLPTILEIRSDNGDRKAYEKWLTFKEQEIVQPLPVFSEISTEPATTNFPETKMGLLALSKPEETSAQTQERPVSGADLHGLWSSQMTLRNPVSLPEDKERFSPSVVAAPSNSKSSLPEAALLKIVYVEKEKLLALTMLEEASVEVQDGMSLDVQRLLARPLSPSKNLFAEPVIPTTFIGSSSPIETAQPELIKSGMLDFPMPEEEIVSTSSAAEAANAPVQNPSSETEAPAAGTKPAAVEKSDSGPSPAQTAVYTLAGIAALNYFTFPANIAESPKANVELPDLSDSEAESESSHRPTGKERRAARQARRLSLLPDRVTVEAEFRNKGYIPLREAAELAEVEPKTLKQKVRNTQKFSTKIFKTKKDVFGRVWVQEKNAAKFRVRFNSLKQ